MDGASKCLRTAFGLHILPWSEKVRAVLRHSSKNWRAKDSLKQSARVGGFLGRGEKQINFLHLVGSGDNFRYGVGIGERQNKWLHENFFQTI